eukprot:SAG11_NODE_2383_length_3424_cov_1.725714_1_plen_316_part_10
MDSTEEEAEEATTAQAGTASLARQGSHTTPVALQRTSSAFTAALIEMGFTHTASVRALAATGNSTVEAALEWLLAQPAEDVAAPQLPPQAPTGGPEGGDPWLEYLSRLAEGGESELLDAVLNTPNAEPPAEPEPDAEDGEGEGEPTDGGPECAICYGEVELAADLRRGAECGHIFHLEPCLRRYFETSVNEGKVLKISCARLALRAAEPPCPLRHRPSRPPSDTVRRCRRRRSCPSCERAVPEADLRDGLSAADFGRFRKFKQSAVLQQDPNIRWCPAPGCGAPIRGWTAYPPPPGVRRTQRRGHAIRPAGLPAAA